jgi:hypothetical protein
LGFNDEKAEEIAKTAVSLKFYHNNTVFKNWNGVSWFNK